jgi:hypothetical protein
MPRALSVRARLFDAATQRRYSIFAPDDTTIFDQRAIS